MPQKVLRLGRKVDEGVGHPLLHCSAQPEPFLSLKSFNHPAYPTKGAYVELNCGCPCCEVLLPMENFEQIPNVVRGIGTSVRRCKLHR